MSQSCIIRRSSFPSIPDTSSPIREGIRAKKRRAESRKVDFFSVLLSGLVLFCFSPPASFLHRVRYAFYFIVTSQRHEIISVEDRI